MCAVFLFPIFLRLTSGVAHAFWSHLLLHICEYVTPYALKKADWVACQSNGK